MAGRRRIAASGLLLFCALARPAGGQSPAGPELRLSARPAGSQYLPALQYLPDGDLVVIWQDQRGASQEDVRLRTLGRTIGRSGIVGPAALLGRNLLTFVLSTGHQVPATFQLLGLGVDDLIDFGQPRIRGMRFTGPASKPLGPPVSIGDENPLSIVRAASRHPSGATLVAWQRFEPALSHHLAMGRILDAADRPQSTFSLFPASAEPSDVAAILLAASEFIVVGTIYRPGVNGADVFLRRVSLGGDLLSPPRTVNSPGPSSEIAVGAAGHPGSGFVVVWSLDGIGSKHIFAQRYSPAGVKVGGPISVNQLPTSPSVDWADVAMDRHGNFAVTWDSPFSHPNRLSQVFVRLFRANGKAVSRERRVDSAPRLGNSAPRVAFGANGVLSIAWHACCHGPALHDVLLRHLIASPGGEPCLVRGQALSCDAGRTGAEAELSYPLDPAIPRQQVVFGDIDGDGRDDPCAWAHGRLRCDTDHQGRQDGRATTIGTAGDTILLADWDADGSDEPCFRRGVAFVCDSRVPPIGLGPNPAQERSVLFGNEADLPLAGDLDGDGRDEFCVVRDGVFRCDMDHKGGAAELEIAFDTAGGVPLLGDFDADGRDDPCVFSAGVFSCDTAHDGGTPEHSLAFGRAGDLPFLPNLDGL